MKKIFFSLILLLNMFAGQFVMAGCSCSGHSVAVDQAACIKLSYDKTGCIWTEDPAPQSQGVTLENPLGRISTPQALIGQIINAALGIVGSLALAMFIYGGFTWMLAAGNSEAVKNGKDILIWASLGLVLIFTAYALTKFVFSSVGANV